MLFLEHLLCRKQISELAVKTQHLMVQNSTNEHNHGSTVFLTTTCSAVYFFKFSSCSAVSVLATRCNDVIDGRMTVGEVLYDIPCVLRSPTRTSTTLNSSLLVAPVVCMRMCHCIQHKQIPICSIDMLYHGNIYCSC